MTAGFTRGLMAATLLLAGCGQHTMAATGQPVVLLHGLARSPASMSRLGDALEAAGYAVCNIGYLSRAHTIEELADRYIAPEIKRCFPGHAGPINFVTHSMGGIVVRQLAAAGTMTNIGRVVMLGPPNQGSEVVDVLGPFWLYRKIGGPAGQSLGTDAVSLPRRLGTASFELGVIAGNRSLNPWLSLLLPGADDGKVSVTGTQVAGMKDFLVLPTSHVFMMRNSEAIQQTLHFLEHGQFQRPSLPT